MEGHDDARAPPTHTWLESRGRDALIATTSGSRSLRARPDAHATCAVRGARQSDRASRGHRAQPKGGASRGGQRARARRASPPCVGRVGRGRALHLDRPVPLEFRPTCGRLSLHLTPRSCRECADTAQTGVFRHRHLPRLGSPPPTSSRISAPPHRARELTSGSFLVPQIALALVVLVAI